LSEEVFGDWFVDSPSLADEFRGGQPFPVLVIDGFVRPEVARQLVDEFPAIDAMHKSRDYIFGSKHELSDLDRFGPASARFGGALLSAPFASVLSALTANPIFVDPSFHGGGFHQAGDGGFLDMHTDFNIHPLHKTWFRMLNVLLYLNPDWKPEYGGELLLKANPGDEPRAVAPAFNRGVIMLTNESTYHGFRPMSLPAGVTRRSIAAYGYRQIAEGEIAPRTTGWVPESAGFAKRAAARHYDTLVQVKNRWFGSGTAKHR
jgi:hypothetical protein